MRAFLRLFVLAVVATIPSLPSAAAILLSDQEWQEAVRSRGVDPTSFSNPLAFDDAMRDFARDAAIGTRAHDRLEGLQRKLFLKHEAPFDYDPHGTLTAKEAFSSRRGNCVAFTNLFIAMARSVGIPVEPALVERRGSLERDGDLVVVNNHVVAIFRHAEGVTVFDFFRTRRNELVDLQPIDDLWSAAIYLNNLGVRALRDGAPGAAIQTLEKAVRLAPGYAPVYGNLGVALRRQGDVAAALDAYLLGLHIDPKNRTLQNNVKALLFERVGRSRAQPFEDIGESTLRSLTEEADQALADQRLREAIRLYRRVHREDPSRVEPLISIARCQLMRGRLAAARRALKAALEIQPEEPTARRLLEALNRAGYSARG